MTQDRKKPGAAFYRPIGWLYMHSGQVIGPAIGAWASLGSANDERFWGLGDDGPFWLEDLTSGT